jgi:hypothetical protein
MDPRVDDVVMRAMARQKEQRFRTAAEVRTCVEAITLSECGCLVGCWYCRVCWFINFP